METIDLGTRRMRSLLAGGLYIQVVYSRFDCSHIFATMLYDLTMT